MADDEEVLVPVFMPALVAVLLRAEKDKGAPLTEAEVLALRDGAQCAMAPRDVTAAVAEGRGYADLDPEDCWAQWQVARRAHTKD